jgi:CDP-paratose 2-epimerase
VRRHLITGGAGFIGVNLAERLLKDANVVTVLDDFSRSGADLNAAWLKEHHPSVNIVTADVRHDHEVVASLVDEVDVVYHLAAQVAVTTSVLDPRMDFERNLLGTFNVLEAVRRSRKPPVLLYASTNKVYGGMEGIPVVEGARRYAYGDGRVGISEEQHLDFHSPYGCSKGGADQYVTDYARMFGLRTVVFRQSCIYGQRQFGIEDQGWLAWFAIAATLGRPVTVFGTGKQVRDVLHISDLIELMGLAVERIDVSAGNVYNVGGGPDNSLSLLESFGLLEQSLDRRIDYSFADARPGDQRIYVSDIRKVAQEFGWAPRVDPKAGVDQLVSWVLENPHLFTNVS